MLNRLQRILTPWLGSAALFLIAAVTGYSAFLWIFVKVNIGWVVPNTPIPDDIGQSMMAFFTASTLALTLLNLVLQRSPVLPLVVSGAMTMIFYLLVLLMLGMMWGTIWFKGAVAIFSGLNILLIRYWLVGTTRDGRYGWARIALAAGSGLLLLYVLVPWPTAWLLLKPAAARDQAAVSTFGATYVAAKNTLQACPAFQQHVGGLVELAVSPHRAILSDGPSHARGSYSFNYSGQQSRGRVGIVVTQEKVTAPSPHGSTTSADLTSTFTSGHISIFREGEGDNASVQISCDTAPPTP